MKYIIRPICLLIAISCSSLTINCSAQKQGQSRIDSLLAQLPHQSEDTNMVKTLADLSLTYSHIDPDQALKYGEQGLALAGKLSWKIGIANANYIIGAGYYSKADYAKSLEYDSISLMMYQEIGNKKGIAKNLSRNGLIYMEESDYPKAMNYFTKALKINQEIDNKAGIAYNLQGIANIYSYQSDYANALDYFLKSLKINEDIGNKAQIRGNFQDLGNIYFSLSDYPKALDYYLKALKMSEELGNKIGIAGNLEGVGRVYFSQSDFPKALDYFLKSEKVYEEVGFKTGIAADFHNIGVTYGAQSDYNKALEYELKALKINEDMGIKTSIAINLQHIGDIYSHQSNFEKELEYNLAALKIFNELGDKGLKGNNFSNMALLYLKISNDSNKAVLNKLFNGNKTAGLQAGKKYADSAIILLKEVGDLDGVQTAYEVSSQIESVLGNYKASLESYKNYTAAKDSTFNMEKNKKLTEIVMQYGFDKKQDSVKTVEAKTEAVHQLDEKRQRIIIYSVAGGLILLLVFLFFLNKEKKKADSLLLNILPTEVASELKANGSAKAKNFDNVTVMFTDFKGFTLIGEQLTPTQLVAEINHCFVAYDNIIQKFGIEKIKTIGDAYLAVCGLPNPDVNHAEKVVKACSEISKFMEEYKADRIKNNLPFFEARIGINSGSVVAGIVGIKKFAYDIWGDTVNTAARMEQNSEAGKINISGSTYELVKDKFSCVHRGKIAAKNKGEIDMYFVNIQG